jgi:N-acetylglucosamine-6-phosphate deacetylase
VRVVDLRYALVNCDVYTSKEVLYDKAVIIRDNQIEQIVDLPNIPSSVQTIDLGGDSVAPGFIDAQVNGGGGYLFNDDPTPATISRIHEAHKRLGTTNFLPTLITTSLDKMVQAVKAVKSCIDRNECGVLGIHLEGPYINEKRAGVHDKKFIRKPQSGEVDSLLRTAPPGVIKILTVAPEIFDPKFVKPIMKNGTRLSVGHSDATYDQTIRAFDDGFSSVTHLFNAMSQFGSREPGVVGAGLERDDVWTGIIADGFHVHFSTIKVSYKAKLVGKLILVTDAMPPTGGAPNLSFKLGDLEIFCKGGRCVTGDGTLAGSALDLASAVRNCIQKIGISKDEALRMASTYVAAYLNVDDKLGKIEPGYLANLTIFNNQIHVRGVIIEGKYEKIQSASEGESPSLRAS